MREYLKRIFYFTEIDETVLYIKDHHAVSVGRSVHVQTDVKFLPMSIFSFTLTKSGSRDYFGFKNLNFT